VATRWTARGTHRGDFNGIPPTGRESTVTGITIDRVSNGQITESWTNWDTFGLLKQLGVVPATAQV
jgi:predicted ester cyclase